MSKKHWSGSTAVSNGMKSAGPVAGAGETAPKGPGKLAVRHGLAPDMYPSAKTPAPQKGVKSRMGKQEEDGD